MCEFLGQIKVIVNELTGIGCLIKPDECIDAILEGLPQDYAMVISVIESKFETPPISEVEALLLTHESRATRFQKKVLPSINYTQSYTTDPRLSIYNNNFRGSYDRNTTKRGGHHRGGRARSRFANFQCQICLKYVTQPMFASTEVIMLINPMNLLHCLILQPISRYNYQPVNPIPTSSQIGSILPHLKTEPRHRLMFQVPY